MNHWLNNTFEGTFTSSVKQITAVYLPSEEFLKSNLKIIKIDGGCTCGGKIIPKITLTKDFVISAVFSVDNKTRKEDDRIIIVYYSNGDKEFLHFKYKII